MYVPTSPPNGDSAAFAAWVQRELRRIAEATASTDTLRFVPQHKEPERPREGDIVYADGTDWNPGAGKGLYQYDGSTWNAL